MPMMYLELFSWKLFSFFYQVRIVCYVKLQSLRIVLFYAISRAHISVSRFIKVSVDECMSDETK